MALAASDKFEMLSAIRHNNLLALKAIVLLAPLQHHYTARNIADFHILIIVIVENLFRDMTSARESRHAINFNFQQPPSFFA